ncbi:MAG TPA: quinone oxidoreductase [Actinomycetota bacterium]
MRAVVITRHGGPEVLEVRDVPEPVGGDGRLVVEVAAAGVNFRDVYEREGAGSYDTPTPLVAGVEGAGVVRAGAGDSPPGARVAWWQAPGSYAEVVALDPAAAVPIPDGVTDEQAAAVLLQGMTAHYLSSDAYAVRPGDWVLVHSAAGGVGLLLTQMVRRAGGRAIATTSGGEKAELARGAGAEEVLGYDEVPERVRAMTGGEGVAAVYDGVGKATFDASLASLRPRGTLVVYGSSSGMPDPVPIPRLNEGSFFVTRPTLHHYAATREELLERAGAVFGMVADGSLSVRIGGRYPLAEARLAHEDLEARRTTGKLLLLPR